MAMATTAVPAGRTAVYISEAVVDLHGARPGGDLPALGMAFAAPAGTRFFVAGVWRDYARQHGSVVMDRADYLRLGGHMDHVRSLEDVLRHGAWHNEGAPSSRRFESMPAVNPWPLALGTWQG